ncbi:CPBP family intramembrane glutamic endopeptidase [Virgibacillus ihumii]|uniref:CPBP family intramembrane glutamic endopeptidase n=1 Tax=Virgibacillus ihumii TaxID=2686091 RepID=UPI00157E24CD|nr:type II CAAX endopeptidase family protein [Virgibacillus ihumii]
MSSYFPRTGKLIGVISMFVILLSSLWLIWIGETNIRYSGDHKGTMPFWNKWIPLIVGILLIRFLPFQRNKYNPLQHFGPRRIIIQTVVLFLCGALFTVCLLIVNFQGMAFQLWFMISKITLLLFTPLMLFLFDRSNPKQQRSKPIKSTVSNKWYWLIPFIVMIIWVYLNFFSVFSTPFVSLGITDPTMLIVTLLVSFLINSLLEELFYRVWLQTRLELILGTWPAILLTSLLWASWHITVHGSGQWNVDMATVITNHGIVGLFLGYLWARYRSVWVIIIVHGLINAHPQQLLEILFN